LEEKDDLELIERCRAGDSRAFDLLVLRYQHKVFNLAYRLLGNYEEAKDMAQEAFVRAFQSLKSFRQESSFYTWLYRIVTNLCKNKMRSWSRSLKPISIDNPIEKEESEVSRTLVDPNLTPAQVLERKNLEQEVQKAIAGLPSKYRLVVVFRDMEELPYEKIANIIGCSVGTVKSRLHRGRMLLRERLKDVMEDGL